MAINPVVAQHLEEARRELMHQRDALDRDIAQLDSMLQGHSALQPAGSFTATTTVSRGPAPAMKDAIVAYLESEGREFSTNEVAQALNERYGWAVSSTRSQISKMGKAHEVIPVRRGVYRAVTPEALNEFLGITPTDTSGPAVAGPEADVTTTDERGGPPHVQTDQDHSDNLT